MRDEIEASGAAVDAACRALLDRVPRATAEVITLADVRAAVEAAMREQPPDTGWISVRDRLPADGDTVLVCEWFPHMDKLEDIHMAYRYARLMNDHWMIAGEGALQRSFTITHWRPMLAMPRRL